PSPPPAPLLPPGLGVALGLPGLLPAPLLAAIGSSPHAPLRADALTSCRGPLGDRGRAFARSARERSEDWSDDPGRELLLPDPQSLALRLPPGRDRHHFLEDLASHRLER